MATRRIPIGLAWSANQVNATVYRVNALASFGPHQFVTYYDPAGRIIIGRRTIAQGEGPWELTTLPDTTANIRDAHNGVVLGVSRDGLVHLSYDHHNNALRYRVSESPNEIRAFGPPRPMTGKTEARVTYPQFVRAPDGTLFFFYRDGASGNGRLCLNRYDANTKTWTALHHPLIDGLNRCNPYWWRPSFGPNNSLHLAWCWRDTPNARTNHDICYARSTTPAGLAAQRQQSAAVADYARKRGDRRRHSDRLQSDQPVQQRGGRPKPSAPGPLPQRHQWRAAIHAPVA
jgi:hypothetical protein